MIARVFHNWERKLAAAADNRVVRPFEWGLDWIEGIDGKDTDVADRLAARGSKTRAATYPFISMKHN